MLRKVSPKLPYVWVTQKGRRSNCYLGKGVVQYGYEEVGRHFGGWPILIVIVVIRQASWLNSYTRCRKKQCNLSALLQSFITGVLCMSRARNPLHIKPCDWADGSWCIPNVDNTYWLLFNSVTQDQVKPRSKHCWNLYDDCKSNKQTVKRF